ncbi:MAG: glycogen synthase GlgA, partial [Candidatus Zixiibacteriota bacterium]
LGYDVKVVMPWYSRIDDRTHQITTLGQQVSIPLGGRDWAITYGRHSDRKTHVDVFFVGNQELFDRDDFYRDPDTGEDWPDNDVRFAVFCRAALQLPGLLEWSPEIIHCHDWQAAIIPALLRADSSSPTPKTVLTIHNLGYQGSFPPERFSLLGLNDALMTPVTGAFEFFGKVNFLKGGIALADRITTVSPRYAEEIQASEEFGFGLQGLLQQRRDVLIGILNGVDYTIWSPTRDKYIPFRYHVRNLSGKRMNKVELTRRAGLPHREKTPLVGMVTRLSDQKGLDLVNAAAEQLMRMNLQLVVLGTGDEKYHRMLSELERSYPDRVKVFLTFNDELAHWIEGGADIFLMPSRYEPCGLNQMYSLKYGTVPVVRKVGGLADTVVDVDDPSGEGNGFVFDDYSAEAMIAALQRAIDRFARRREWMRLMKVGMTQDFSWDRSAREYGALYDSLVAGE